MPLMKQSIVLAMEILAAARQRTDPAATEVTRRHAPVASAAAQQRPRKS